MIDYKELLNLAIVASIEAGERIMEVYMSDEFGVTQKDDRSPLTLADKNSHETIITKLGTGIPILSEEGKEVEYNLRKDWDPFWLIDPLDGTKEFIKRNGEFTVNIALIENESPTIGVIYVPVSKKLYFASKTNGSFTKDLSDSFNYNIENIITESTKLPIVQENRNFTIVVSRSHMSEETERFMAQLKTEHDSIDTISIGSSLKLCMVAEGKANVYPRFAPTMEWDTAAGHAIAIGAGKEVFDYSTGIPMKYNKENLKNNWFIVK